MVAIAEAVDHAPPRTSTFLLDLDPALLCGLGLEFDLVTDQRQDPLRAAGGGAGPLARIQHGQLIKIGQQNAAEGPFHADGRPPASAVTISAPSRAISCSARGPSSG